MRAEKLPDFAVSEPEAVKKATRRKKLIDTTAEEDLSAVLATDSGKRFMRRLLAETRLLEDTFNPDPYCSAHNAGVRSIGVMLAKWIRAADAAALPEVMLGKDNG